MATPVIAPAKRFIPSHKQWGLSDTLTPKDISYFLKRKVRQEPRSSDGKVKHCWDFTVDGQECSIWDYYGVRWSAYGPREAFDKLGLRVFPG